MKNVKITILKTTLDAELAAQYGVPGLTACPMMREGGKTLFYHGDWIAKPNVAICSCNDGLRPVIMKLEGTDEEAELSYVPVR